MSQRRNAAQVYRPYKIEIFGLQDNYIGTLQSYSDTFIGRIRDPKLRISDDGTQTFTCSLPKFYIDKDTNLRVLNPRWEDAVNGVLAENTRVLKIFIQHAPDREPEVYPMIIDKIVDARSTDFSVVKEITASGLAFAELGKTGYKLELTNYTAEEDYEDNEDTITTINYWLDKVFPNKKVNGRVTEWLTPWCYEIRMDWSYYSDERDSDKVYDNAYTSSWEFDDDANPTALFPSSTVAAQEKARLLNCKESNKYNITQSIAETFEVFCRYEYKCDRSGRFIGEYTDGGKVWTGRKVIFYNKAIKTENPVVLDYQKNLSIIRRTSDSTDFYTKLYVTPIQSDNMTNGYITIADTQANPLLDDFILNFDYLKKTGCIREDQIAFVEKEYPLKIREYNSQLISKGEDIETKTIELNDKESLLDFIGYQIDSINESLESYQTLYENEVTNEPVVHNKNNSYSVVFTEDTNSETLTASFHGKEGIDEGSIIAYLTNEYNEEEIIFASRELIDDNEYHELIPGSERVKTYSREKAYLINDEDGFPKEIRIHSGNKLGKDKATVGPGRVYLQLTYSPKNKYKTIYDSLVQRKGELTTEQTTTKAAFDALTVEKAALEKEYDDILFNKNTLNLRLENLLGPALREGYWAPSEYEDPAKTYKEFLSATIPGAEDDNVNFIFDSELFEGEATNYYEINEADGADNLVKKYYPYIKANDEKFVWENASLKDLVLHFRRAYTYVTSETLKIEKNKNYSISLPVYVETTETQTDSSGNTSTSTTMKQQYINHYFKVSKDLAKGTELKITYKGNERYLTQNSQKVTLTTKQPSGDIIDITERFAYKYTDEYNKEVTVPLNKTLGEFLLYNNSGFKFAYKKNAKGTVTPIIMLTEVEPGKNGANSGRQFNPFEYESVAYSFITNKTITTLGNVSSYVLKWNEKKDIFVYPRIKMNQDNIQYGSDLLKVYHGTTVTGEDGKIDLPDTVKALTKFEDYYIYLRKGTPYCTLKTTDVNTFNAILNDTYKIVYQVSKANEMMYLDAKEIAEDNANPRYSYEVVIANLPEEISLLSLGEMLYINDHALGVHAATGYVNSVEYALDKPQTDTVTIQNYKTKFEDLFKTITAQSEAMVKNSHGYDVTVGKFNSDGSLSSDVLQKSIDNTSMFLNFSNSDITISDKDGIVLTNSSPYINGVYGQMKLQGGGIFISNSVDAAGNRIWSSSITPLGINASLLTAGQINTETIKILSGNNIAFQWNRDGIFAYKSEDETPNEKIYVRFSQYGVQCIDNTLTNWSESNLENNCQALVSLNWDGLVLRNKSGEKTLYLDADTGDINMSGTIRSFNYRTGIIGRGWCINNDGDAEFNNVKVRGTIAASVFKYEETSAVGGELWVAPTLIVLENETAEAITTVKKENGKDYISISFDFAFDEETTAAGRAWNEKDLIGFNGAFIYNGELYEIKNLRMTINSIAAIDNSKSSKITLVSEADFTGGYIPATLFYDNSGALVTDDTKRQELFNALTNETGTLKGSGSWHIIFMGADGQTEGILITAMGASGPYIDIYDESSQNSKTSLRARLGKLDGLQKNEDAKEIYPNINGYGLYSDNVYLRGAIYATSGKIGNLTINEVVNSATSLNVRLDSLNGLSYREGTEVETVLLGAITTSKGVELGLSDFGEDKEFSIDSITFQKQSGNVWEDITTNVLSSSVIMSAQTAYRIKLNYTYNSTNSPNTVYSNIITFSISGAILIKTTIEYVTSTSGTIIPDENANWSETVPEAKQGEFIWSRTTLEYSDLTTSVSYTVSAPGSVGPSAVEFKIEPSVVQILRDITGLKNNKITLKINKIIGDKQENITNLAAENCKVNIANITGNTVSGTIATLTNTLEYSLDNYDTGKTYSSVNSIKFDLYNISTNSVLTSITVPFILGEDLRELAKVKDGEVVINDGKVYAEALAAGSIVAGKVSAGAVTTGAIASNSSLFLLTGDGFNMPPQYSNKTWTPYTGATALTWTNTTEYTNQILNGYNSIWNNNKYDSGVKISPEGVFIKGGGKFVVDMDNFKVNENGRMTAVAGTIGGWTIIKDRLYSKHTEDTYISLIAAHYEGNNIVTTSDSTAIMIGSSDYLKAPFRVTFGGGLYAKKGKVGCLTINGENSLTATVDTATLTIAEQGISIGVQETESIFNANGLNANYVKTKILEVTEIKQVGGGKAKYGWILSDEKPAGVNDVLWLKPLANAAVGSAVIKWETLSGRGPDSYFMDTKKSYYTNNSGYMPIASIPELKTGTSYDYTLTVPVQNIPAYVNGVEQKDQKITNLKATFYLTINGTEYVFEQAEARDWDAWEGGTITVVKTGVSEDLFSLIAAKPDQVKFQFKANYRPDSFCIERNSSITLTGKAYGVSEDEPITCSVYYIP